MTLRNYSHTALQQLLLSHVLTVVQKLWSIGYNCNLNNNDTTEKPPDTVMDSHRVVQNFRTCDPMYYNCSRKEKWLSQRFTTLGTSKQSMQDCANTPLPMCKIQATRAQRNKHRYPAADVASWTTFTKCAISRSALWTRILKIPSITRTLYIML